MSFSGLAGIPTGTPQTVTMTVTNPTANKILVQQTVSWLSIVPNLSGGYATVATNGSALVPGTYCTVVNVALLTASDTILSSRDVAVKFVVGAAPTLSAAPPWTSYNGNLDPTANGALTWENGTTGKFIAIGTPFVDSDGNTVTYTDFLTPNGDGTLALDSSFVPLQRSLVSTGLSPYNIPPYPRYLTFLTRVMPAAGVAYNTNLRLWDFELSFADSRLLFSLRGDPASNNVRLVGFEEGGDDVQTQLDMSVPHVFQISVAMTSKYGGAVSVFADGNATPIIGPLSTGNMRRAASLNSEHIFFGDNRNLPMRGNLDWMIWTTQGAFTPSQLNGKLPSGLGITTGY